MMSGMSGIDGRRRCRALSGLPWARRPGTQGVALGSHVAPLRGSDAGLGRSLRRGARPLTQGVALGFHVAPLRGWPAGVGAKPCCWTSACPAHPSPQPRTRPKVSHAVETWRLTRPAGSGDPPRARVPGLDFRPRGDYLDLAECTVPEVVPGVHRRLPEYPPAIGG